jgi:hypothetical protein
LALPVVLLAALLAVRLAAFLDQLELSLAQREAEP